LHPTPQSFLRVSTLSAVAAARQCCSIAGEGSSSEFLTGSASRAVEAEQPRLREPRADSKSKIKNREEIQ